MNNLFMFNEWTTKITKTRRVGYYDYMFFWKFWIYTSTFETIFARVAGQHYRIVIK